MILFLTALMAGATLLAQSGAEQPDKYSAECIKQTYAKREVYIAMRDGVRLFTSIYEPRDNGSAHPIMLMRTCYTCSPYGEDNFRSFAAYAPYVDAGYIFVFQDVRGKNMSEGEFEEIRPFIENKKLSRKASQNVGQTDEASDTYDTVEWLVHNTFNNGCVGMQGISYPGFYSTMGALAGHPAIKAVSPQAPVTDWFHGDDAHHNGALMLAETVSFQGWFEYGMSHEAATTGKRDFRFPNLMHSDIYSDYLNIGTYANYTSAYADSLKYLRTLREHPDWDSYWETHTVTKGHLHDVKPAVMVVGGLFDKEDCYGAFDTYKAIREQSPETELYLVEGPWFHGAWSREMGEYWGNVYFGPEATADYYLEHFEYPFFSYYLEGKGEKPAQGAQVFDSGSRQWIHYGAGWPGATVSEATPFYLHSDLSVSTTAPSDGGTVGYVSDPAHPVPYRAAVERSVNMDYMIDDQRFASFRPDVLTFRSDVLSSEVVVRGEIEVDLKVDISTTDADFIVKLIDVYPDDFSWSEIAGAENAPRSYYPMGGYQLMVRGEVMRGKYRESFSNPVPFRPGETTTVRFRMPDVCHTFAPGHRIMVQIQSSWFPLVDRNPQTFCNIYTCDESAYIPSRINVHCEKDAASRILLPIENR